MAKKRQKDFQPVKLKPGRRVSKAANITETRFKAKKIVMPNPKVKVKDHSTNTISDCMKIVKENSHLTTRKKALINLNELILKDPESLTPFLSDVLEHVLRLILDMEPSLRNAALEVIITILTIATDLQLQSFIPLFVSIISCCMAHTSLKIKEYSLKLLMTLLQKHSSLICHSIDILIHLLQMFTGVPQLRNSTYYSRSKNVTMLYSEDIFFPDWQIHILNHIDVFLKEMLKKKLAKEDYTHDDQEVYFDSTKKPLSLQVYAESGLKPFDIEKYYSSSQEDTEDSDKFSMFLEEIVKILPFAFIEEIAVEKKCDDNTYDFRTIKNINIIFEIFNSVSELLQSKHMGHLDESIYKFLKDYVYNKRRFPFSEKGVIFGKDEKAVVCIQLNLYVISLLFTYLQDCLKEKSFLDTVFGYMDFVYKLSSDLKSMCIPTIVKILNTYTLSKETSQNSEFLRDSMTQLCSLFKLYDDDNDKKHMLLSFFTKITLGPDYTFIGETDYMKNWFLWLLNELFEMSKTGKVNEKLLKLMEKIASRRFKCFQMCLRKFNFPHLLGLLKSDNEHICSAVLYLIYNMEIIDDNMLRSICIHISNDDGIPTQFTIRLIRFLAYRFYEESVPGENAPENSIHTGKGVIVFARFLLNIALDSYNLAISKFISFDSNEYAESLKMFENVTSYIVIPSLHWKRHSAIFETCQLYLNQLPQHVVHAVSEKMFREIWNNMTNLPMHCTIAIFKLMKPETRQKKKYRAQISDIVFACLLTASILTSMPIDEDWYNYNVLEIIKSIQINSQLALNVVHSMEYLENGYDGLTAYYMLRVCKYFVEKQLLDTDHFHSAVEILECLKDKCSDQTLGQQPLFNTLFNHFRYYM